MVSCPTCTKNLDWYLVSKYIGNSKILPLSLWPNRSKTQTFENTCWKSVIFWHHFLDHELKTYFLKANRNSCEIFQLFQFFFYRWVNNCSFLFPYKVHTTTKVIIFESCGELAFLVHSLDSNLFFLTFDPKKYICKKNLWFSHLCWSKLV